MISSLLAVFLRAAAKFRAEPDRSATSALADDLRSLSR